MWVLAYADDDGSSLKKFKTPFSMISKSPTQLTSTHNIIFRLLARTCLCVKKFITSTTIIQIRCWILCPPHIA